ncbi:XAP5-domain-containing protein [Patellaria atrata CBS 101060]|uniref:XAP5-domain-containing protein n=1 Tax=Patellaria atrata CBS 101060 TaxID=1346257 RepID=A0A9P4VSM8_9PEZI|nr:XAP5-domain-containing protein [Patellaria atrata CBS 101060]
MGASNPPSNEPSRSSTPTTAANSRFTSQQATAEDVLKSQTVGLVNLSEFRKRRAEAIEQKATEAFSTHNDSGSSTPRDGASTPQPKKKKRKNVNRGKLSFDLDEEEEGSSTSAAPTPRSNTPDDRGSKSITAEEEEATLPRRLGPNSNVKFVPKAVTKSALLKEAQTREQLRKEFLAMQEAVKATEIVIPFVFFDGTNIPGGMCKLKKGDHIWLFLDRARKVGAETGVGGGDKSRKDWARISVDDLMLVRDEIIIPHHYEFYYFLINKTVGFNGRLFNYSPDPTSTTILPTDKSTNLTGYDPLSRPNKEKKKAVITAVDSELEGFKDDPTATKVVDRRWYERNKHIYPASVWEEFDPMKDYSKGLRKDQEGNAFFLASR